ncbi:MAG: redox-regulated ATPase YchF [Puniceicoccales bacterium]|jgi:GTP-binding protein YchF|nr:redox-regulated ATPase YchF [Puniceicoccales bacterium]
MALSESDRRDRQGGNAGNLRFLPCQLPTQEQVLGTMRVGIVGLPNVGKSTLFNALTRSRKAEARNYPFCTIEPNVGIVQVPDRRLAILEEMFHPLSLIPAAIEFVDIAGLVAGASRGEGLGNKFLASIREMDALVHVVRCFEDGDILHSTGNVDGLRDLEIIQTELLLADLESLRSQLERGKKRAKALDKEVIQSCALMEQLIEWLDGGQPAHTLSLPNEEIPLLRRLCLLTAKPILYACNVSEEDLAHPENNPQLKAVRTYAESHRPAEVCAVSARLEEELGDLSAEEAQKFLAELSICDSGVSELIARSYRLLNLASFFTAGEKEVRAWTFRLGMRAPACAGAIHGDFEKGFIRAEIVAYEDLVRHGGVAAARAAGRYRMEGKDYEMKDGDVANFRFN